MATTLSELRIRVYRRLGERLPDTPTVAEPEAVDEEINEAALSLLRELESHGVRPLNESSTLSVTSGTQEYDLYAATSSRYRSHLFVLRTDEATDDLPDLVTRDKPLPAIWPHGGDFQTAEFVRRNGFIGGQMQYWLSSTATPRLYLRGKYLGFVETPTEDQSLRLYYSPVLTKLVGNDDTLEEALDQWNDYVVLLAAEVLFGDENGPGAQGVRIRRAEALGRIQREARATRKVSRGGRASRWDDGNSIGVGRLNIPGEIE